MYFCGTGAAIDVLSSPLAAGFYRLHAVIPVSGGAYTHGNEDGFNDAVWLDTAARAWHPGLGGPCPVDCRPLANWLCLAFDHARHDPAESRSDLDPLYPECRRRHSEHRAGHRHPWFLWRPDDKPGSTDCRRRRGHRPGLEWLAC